MKKEDIDIENLKNRLFIRLMSGTRHGLGTSVGDLLLEAYVALGGDKFYKPPYYELPQPSEDATKLAMTATPEDFPKDSYSLALWLDKAFKIEKEKKSVNGTDLIKKLDLRVDFYPGGNAGDGSWKLTAWNWILLSSHDTEESANKALWALKLALETYFLKCDFTSTSRPTVSEKEI